MSDKCRLSSARLAFLLRQALRVRFRKQPSPSEIVEWVKAHTRGALSILASWVLVLSGPQSLVASEAHQHGRASISVVLDGQELAVLLEGPAEHFLGFEHAPSTQEETTALRSIVDSFDETPLLVPTAAARCQRIANSNTQYSDRISGSGHHMEFRMQWEWQCEEPVRVRVLLVDGADRISGVEEVNITLITHHTQAFSRASFPRASLELPFP